MILKNPLFSMLLLFLSLISLLAYAENVVLVQHFSALNGTVDFLPGAWVSVFEDGKSTYYRYDGGKYIKADKLPDVVKGWKAYSGDADYLDQIARADFDPDISHALPKLSKVKKVIEISHAGHGLTYVCYSLPTTDSDALRPDATDIYLAVFASPETSSRPTYKVLKTLKLESEVSYGQMSIQKVGGVGSFLVFYWGQPTGDSSVDGLDVYRIDNE